MSLSFFENALGNQNRCQLSYITWNQSRIYLAVIQKYAEHMRLTYSEQ